MSFKSLLYWTVVICAAFEIGAALYARIWDGAVETRQGMFAVDSDREVVLSYALNAALPIACIAFLLLLYIRKLDPVAGVPLLFAVALHFIGVDQMFRSLDTMYPTARPPLTALAWWAPDNFL